MSGAVLVNESYIAEWQSNTHLPEEKSSIFLEAAMCMSASSAGVALPGGVRAAESDCFFHPLAARHFTDQTW